MRGHPAFAQLSAEQQDLAVDAIRAGSRQQHLGTAGWQQPALGGQMASGLLDGHDATARRAPARVKRLILWHNPAAVETGRPSLFFRRVGRWRRRLPWTRLRSGSGRALEARCRPLPRLLRLLEPGAQCYGSDTPRPASRRAACLRHVGAGAPAGPNQRQVLRRGARLERHRLLRGLEHLRRHWLQRRGLPDVRVQPEELRRQEVHLVRRMRGGSDRLHAHPNRKLAVRAFVLPRPTTTFC